MDNIRVLVVDDSLFMRKVISDILSSDSQIEVVGEAVDGKEALNLINKFNPDVVTLDYEMPSLNGLETLREIMKLEVIPRVVMVSGYTVADSEITLLCLDAGAVDFVLKPSGGTSMDMLRVKKDIIEKVKAAAEINISKNKIVKAKEKDNKKNSFRNDYEGIVVVGASTGGPAALEHILPNFPSNYPLPVLVAQHLPEHFTKTFSIRLDKLCLMNFVEANDGQEIKKGTIYLAPGGKNMEIVKDDEKLIIKISENVSETETPSISLLMKSAAKIYGEKTIGVILTGMGKDGCTGMEAIFKAGGETIVQDEESSVVFGMGKEVVDKALAKQVVPLENIFTKIIELTYKING